MDKDLMKKMYYHFGQFLSLFLDGMARWGGLLLRSEQVEGAYEKHEVELVKANEELAKYVAREKDLVHELTVSRTQLSLEKEKFDKMFKGLNDEKAKVAEEREGLARAREAVKQELVAVEKVGVELRAQVDHLTEEKEWLISKGVARFVTNLLHSQEFNAPLADIYAKAIAFGRHGGIQAGFKAAEEGQKIEELPSFKPSSGEDFVSDVKAMEVSTYPYIANIAKASQQPISFLQGLEPEGLKKGVANEVFNSYVSKRPIRIMLEGADGGEGSSKRLKPADSFKVLDLEQVFENPSPSKL